MSELLPILNTLDARELRISLDGYHAHQMLQALVCCQQLLRTCPQAHAQIDAFLDDYDPALDRNQLLDLLSFGALQLASWLTIAATTSSQPAHTTTATGTVVP